MQVARTFLFLLAACGGVAVMAAESAAQPAYLNPQRDCQTIRTCNFARGGAYRGCLSSYSCRVCRFVRSSCQVGAGRRGVCQQMRCTWG
jgi:hypothetical protein